MRYDPNGPISADDWAYKFYPEWGVCVVNYDVQGNETRSFIKTVHAYNRVSACVQVSDITGIKLDALQASLVRIP